MEFMFVLLLLLLAITLIPLLFLITPNMWGSIFIFVKKAAFTLGIGALTILLIFITYKVTLKIIHKSKTNKKLRLDLENKKIKAVNLWMHNNNVSN